MAATHTTNLGLNKPDRQDFVSVVTDINDNMDMIDTAIGNPSSASGVTGNNVYAKIGTLDSEKIDISNIVDNLTTNDPSKPLSAAQGYGLNSNMKNRVFTLADATILANGTNINTINTYGCYSIISINSATTMSNLPIATAGSLYVRGAMGTSGENYLQQVFIPYAADAIYIRMTNNNGSSWFAWRVIGQEDGWWHINIPRATFTTLTNNRWHRQGNIVFCETCINITASQTGNAYIGSDCIPKFGLTLGNVQGVWHDYNADKSGTVAGYNGGNIWMALNGNGPAPLTDFVGHSMGITLTAMLH